ncbi:MAG: hypothetical protein Q8K86_07705 [Candidatus Nanopelagicaceae bacterium]|nr:hypothetical protein [Candidatus Nanopelagicaceae bacterium]
MLFNKIVTAGSDFLKNVCPHEEFAFPIMSGHMQVLGILNDVDAERILLYREGKGVYETTGKSPFSRRLSQSWITVT